MKIDLISDTEERILCAWAKAILVVGIIEGVIAIILVIVYSVMEESFLFFFIGIAGGALLFVPFLLVWAMMRVIAKMSLNLSASNTSISACNLAIGRLTTVLSSNSVKKTENSSASTKTNLAPKNNTTLEKTSNEVKKKPSIDVERGVQSALSELNKVSGDEAEKLCRLMELRDDGTISTEVYDILIEKIS